MNKSSLVKIRNISLAFLIFVAAVAFFLDNKSCYYRGSEIVIGIGFVVLLSTSIVWYPDLFICIYTDSKIPPDEIPSWKDVASSRKNTLAIVAFFILVGGIGMLYMGISKL